MMIRMRHIRRFQNMTYQSPCYPIIAVKQDYFYCGLHPDVQNVRLESVEHHVKYKDPDKHKLELLKFQAY
jgi:hypothetical protein